MDRCRPWESWSENSKVFLVVVGFGVKKKGMKNLSRVKNQGFNGKVRHSVCVFFCVAIISLLCLKDYCLRCFFKRGWGIQLQLFVGAGI